MTKLHLVSLCLIGLCTPAFAETSSAASSMAPASPPPADMSAPADAASDVSTAPDASSEVQPAVPAVPSKDALTAFVKTCTDISGGDPKAYDRATADGWVPDDASDSGPDRKIYSAAKDVGGYGSVTLWGSVDTYPSQQLGYCRVDFGDYDNLINFGDLTGMQGLSGSATTADANGNVYGAWETADKKLLVIADRTDGQVEIEFNILLGDKK